MQLNGQSIRHNNVWREISTQLTKSRNMVSICPYGWELSCVTRVMNIKIFYVASFFGVRSPQERHNETFTMVFVLS